MANAVEPYVVVARIGVPGASPEQVDQQVAIPLEQAVVGLAGIKAVKSRCEEGKLALEVHFAGAAGQEELARVAKVVRDFRPAASTPIGEPQLTLEPASML